MSSRNKGTTGGTKERSESRKRGNDSEAPGSGSEQEGSHSSDQNDGGGRNTSRSKKHSVKRSLEEQLTKSSIVLEEKDNEINQLRLQLMSMNAGQRSNPVNDPNVGT